MFSIYFLCLLIGVVISSPTYQNDVKLDRMMALLKRTQDHLAEENDLQKRGWCSYELGYENKCKSDAPWCYTGVNSDGVTVTTCSPTSDPCGGDACKAGEICMKTGDRHYNLGFQCVKEPSIVVGLSQIDDRICDLCTQTGRTCVQLPGNDLGCFYPQN
ncbi:uncharacterized protein [Ptychodera flava]|uniref:uncharacterized protein isoform X1 n=1 Tax=Ptychodera flava TaxID=63121 RepID=UPI003969DAE2